MWAIIRQDDLLRRSRREVRRLAYDNNVINGLNVTLVDRNFALRDELAERQAELDRTRIDLAGERRESVAAKRHVAERDEKVRMLRAHIEQAKEALGAEQEVPF